MELPSLLQDLHLLSSSSSSCPSEKDPPCHAPLPIVELLSQLQEKLTGPSSSSEKVSLIGRAEVLFRKADADWLLSAASSDGERAELRSAYRSLVSALIGCAALPDCEDDCASLPSSAYQDVPSRAAAVCSALAALLGILGRGGVRAGLLAAVAPDVCVFAVTHFQEQLWTSSSSRLAARGLQGELLKAGGWRDPAHLLMGDGNEDGDGGGILGGILDVLQPRLKKDSWWRCEPVKLVFAWTLLQVTRPSLSPHLPHLLPPSLLLNDHYRPENCILGIRCLHHIVLNAPAAELRHFNRAEVIYTALFKHLYTTEADIIQASLSCLLDLLLVLESPPSSLAPSSCPRTPGRHDDVLRLVLTNMEAEHKVALRRVYAAALPPYIERMGTAVCRHLRRLDQVLLGYLEVGDPAGEASRLAALVALQGVIRGAWPRMESRLDLLLRGLLKLLLDVSADSALSDDVKQQLRSQATLCIQLLDHCCHQKLQPLLQQVDSSCCSDDVLGCLAAVTVTTGR